MTAYVKVQKNVGFVATLETLVVNEVKRLHRSTFNDGSVKITSAGPTEGGPFERDQAEWDRRTANVPRI